MTSTAPHLAFLVQPEEHYGTRKLTAHVVIVQPGGELYNPPTWDYSGSGGAEYNGLTVSAYMGDTAIGGTRTGGNLWGFGYAFREVHHIERADHAKAIARVLTRISNHLDRANQSAGYLSESDFHGYVLRVATALKIKDIYVLNTKKAREMSGNRERKVDGSGLQMWISHVCEYAEKNELHTIGMAR